MFIERCGKFFFSHMRPFFFFLLLLFPVLTASALLFFKYMDLEEIEGHFAATALKERLALERKFDKEQFLQRYSQSDPYFIDRKIESLSFLKQEKEQLESLVRNGITPNSRALKERLSFLTGGDNRLLFSEENIRSAASVREVEEKQRHPVQMDRKDLSELLALIEDVEIETAAPSTESPQLLIRDFRIKKQTTALQTEVFEVEMDLLKREFIKK